MKGIYFILGNLVVWYGCLDLIMEGLNVFVDMLD